MSWALMRNPAGLECGVFATHAWAEGIFEFCIKVRQAWPIEAKNLYACFLANPQNGVVSEILSAPIPESPFAQALSSAEHVIVIPNKRVSIYSRLWCVYEAHVAVKAIEKRKMKIQLPARAPAWSVFVHLSPGLALFVAFAVAAFYLEYLVDIARHLGPMLWVIVFYCLSISVENASLMWAYCRERPMGRKSRIVVAWVQLGILGYGLGLARFDLREDHHTSRSFIWQLRGQTFLIGEGWVIIPLAGFLVLSYLRHIACKLNAEALKSEGELLQFKSVRHAVCSDMYDQERIKEIISGSEDEVDNTIKTLQSVGRYDSAVRFNIDLGMSREHARDGLDFYRIIAAVFAWEYWWVTDLSGNEYHVLCVILPTVSSALAVAFVHCVVGDKAIIMVDLMFWMGLAFVVISMVQARLFGWSCMGMSYSSLGVQALALFVTVLASIPSYTGHRRRLLERLGIIGWYNFYADVDTASPEELSPRWSVLEQVSTRLSYTQLAQNFIDDSDRALRNQIDQIEVFRAATIPQIESVMGTPSLQASRSDSESQVPRSTYHALAPPTL